MPDESFVPAVLQPCKREELTPHAAKVCLAFASLGAEDECVRIVAKSETSLLERLDEPFGADEHKLLFSCGLLPFGLHFNGIQLSLFAVHRKERWPEVDVLQLNQHHFSAPNTRIERHHQPQAHQIA